MGKKEDSAKAKNLSATTPGAISNVGGAATLHIMNVDKHHHKSETENSNMHESNKKQKPHHPLMIAPGVSPSVDNHNFGSNEGDVVGHATNNVNTTRPQFDLNPERKERKPRKSRRSRMTVVDHTTNNVNITRTQYDLKEKQPRKSRRSRMTHGPQCAATRTVETPETPSSSDWMSVEDRSVDSSWSSVYPGAVPVEGILGSADGDEGTIGIGSSTINNDEQLQVEEDEAALLDAEVVDEEAIRNRVRERVENRLVQETVDASIVQATGETKNRAGKKGENGSESRVPIIGLVVITVVAVATVVGIIIGGKKEGSKGSPTSDDASTALSTFEQLRQLLTPLLPNGIETLYDDTTNQYQTLQWLAFEDEYYMMETLEESSSSTTTSSVMITERFVLALLYFATGGPEGYWTYDFGFLSNLSVCEWPPINSGSVNETFEDSFFQTVRCDKISGSVKFINLGTLMFVWERKHTHTHTHTWTHIRRLCCCTVLTPTCL